MAMAPTPLLGCSVKYNKNGEFPVYVCVTCRKIVGKTQAQYDKHDCEAELRRRACAAENIKTRREACLENTRQKLDANHRRAAHDMQQRMLIHNMDSSGLAQMLNARLQLGSGVTVMPQVVPPTCMTVPTTATMTPPTAPALPPKPDATSLAAMPTDEQRSTLGEHLFPRVSSVLQGMQREGLAPKVTGMLLHTDDVGALLALLDHDELLEAAIRRALDTIAPLIT